MSALTIGQFVAKYRVVRKLGAGGMGEVYEVEDSAIGQRGALKVLTLDVAAHPELFQRFIREARAANQIRHPGVVKVFDFGQSDGAPWLMMEYLDGESLASRMTALLRTPAQCMGLPGLWVVSELASVLLAAHRAGITHRDLKPANVMLVPDPLSDTGERVKLLDFGIAKLHGDSLTQSGTMLGTPVYMAPEQFKNAAAVDGQADVYSLGTILYQLLCGRLPYQIDGGGDGTYALMAAKCFDEPTPLSSYAPTLPSELQALVTRMLAREPGQRPTIAAVEIEVRRLLGLPPPRASGFHNQVAGLGSGSADAQPVATDEEQLMPTVDGPLSEQEHQGAARLVAEAVKAETPSAAAGEISPVGMPVPPSLSSQPSLLATPAKPALRAAPAEKTAPGAPEPRIAAALASPSSPTAAEPARRRWPRVLAGTLALAAAAATTATVWTMRQPVPRVRYSADPPPSSTPDGTSPQANPKSTSGQAHPASPDPTPAAPVPADALPASPSPQAGVQPLANPAPAGLPLPVEGGVAQRHPKSACVAPTSACVTGAMTSEQRHAVLRLLDEVDIKLCTGDCLIITGRPALAVRGPGIRRDALDQFLFALRGWLAKGKLTAPDRVDIRCKAK